MSDWLTTTTAIGAGAAIVQPWIISLWKRYALRGRIQLYTTGFFELGFSEYGPTLGIDGTVRVLDRDLFVSAIDVELTHRRDKAEHRFEWLAFRPHRIPLVGAASGPGFIEAASGFMVLRHAPRRLNILFTDSATRQRVQEKLAPAIARFWELRRSDDFHVLDQHELLGAPAKLDLIQRLSDSYRKDSVHLQAFGELERLCYWETGTYDLDIKVHTAGWPIHPPQRMGGAAMIPPWRLLKPIIASTMHPQLPAALGEICVICGWIPPLRFSAVPRFLQSTIPATPYAAATCDNPELRLDPNRSTAYVRIWRTPDQNRDRPALYAQRQGYGAVACAANGGSPP